MKFRSISKKEILTKRKTLPRELNNVKYLKENVTAKTIIGIIGRHKNISDNSTRPIEYLVITDDGDLINIWNKRLKDKSFIWYVAGKDVVSERYFKGLIDRFYLK